MAERKRLITPVFKTAFPNVYEPQSFEGGALRFGLTAIWTPTEFTENDKKRWVELRNALDEAAVTHFKRKLTDLPDNFKKALRKGTEKADLEGFGEGTIFANLTTKMRPGIVDHNRQKIGPEFGNQDEIFPGVYCRATVNVYSFENKGKGVAIGLMNLQKIPKAARRLDNRVAADKDFEDSEIDQEWIDQAAEASDDFLDDDL